MKKALIVIAIGLVLLAAYFYDESASKPSSSTASQSSAPVRGESDMRGLKIP